jgi:alkylation response protein AidB-like acyl-CoA dehydrogenase
MNLTPSPEQAGFAAVLHDVLTDAAEPLVAGLPPAPAAGADARLGAGEARRAVWARLAEVGVTGLAVPARWGGAGAEPADLVVAGEELGHHALPGPIAESVAAVPALLAALGNGPADKWLPELAAGRMTATLAAPPWLPYAADADAADLVLFAEPGAVRLARPGAAHPSMDRTRRLFDVHPGAVLAAGPAADAAVDHALDLGVLTCAAQLLGAGRALLEAAVQYATRRTQFGRPIGQYQAVQHLLADVAVGLEFARPLLYAAAVALSTGPQPPAPDAGPQPPAPDGGPEPPPPNRGPEPPAPNRGPEPPARAARDVSAAKVACGDAAHRAARAALQVHGAIGYTEEHGLGRWLTKVRVLTLAWGTPADHRARVMRELTRCT